MTHFDENKLTHAEIRQKQLAALVFPKIAKDGDIAPEVRQVVADRLPTEVNVDKELENVWEERTR